MLARDRHLTGSPIRLLAGVPLPPPSFLSIAVARNRRHPWGLRKEQGRASQNTRWGRFPRPSVQVLPSPLLPSLATPEVRAMTLD